MKNIIFNNYEQILRDSGHQKIITFDKHIADTYFHKGVLGLGLVTLSCLFLRYFTGYTFFGVIFLILLFVTPLFFNFIKFIKSREKLIMTKDSLIVRTGFLFVDVMEYKLSTIETIQIKYSPLSSYFYYGDVVIRGNGGTTTTIERIEYPHEVYDAFEEKTQPPKQTKKNTSQISKALMSQFEKLLENKN